MVADRHRDVGRERPFSHWCSPLFEIPRRFDKCLRVKCGGRVKAAPAASAASEALTRPSASTEFALRSGGMFEPPSCGSGSHQASLTKAEVPVLVTDDEVVE